MSAISGVNPQTIDDVFYVSVVIVIYAIGYLGLRQPIIFARDPAGEAANKKYEKSAIDADMSNALLVELRQHMASAKPYLDGDLTLAELARQLKISQNYLSQVINEQTGKNFFDFVNEHRIEAAKRVLADRDRSDAKVLTIAMDAGFNSKTAFYEAFKKHVGQTPRQYRLSVVPAAD
ncbi:MAG: AraC family transcriptional regulator [Gammaproteobacteria bacterium]|nr:AraC family transcriptional regulator [Gammaproteobacteria bacterium]